MGYVPPAASDKTDKVPGADELEAAGYRVLRISWRQLVEEPLVIAATLAVALAGSSWSIKT